MLRAAGVESVGVWGWLVCGDGWCVGMVGVWGWLVCGSVALHAPPFGRRAGWLPGFGGQTLQVVSQAHACATAGEESLTRHWQRARWTHHVPGHKQLTHDDCCGSEQGARCKRPSGNEQAATSKQQRASSNEQAAASQRPRASSKRAHDKAHICRRQFASAKEQAAASNRQACTFAGCGAQAPMSKRQRASGMCASGKDPAATLRLAS
eukprot:351151-Chlamydomonas_euryale.AAC.7